MLHEKTSDPDCWVIMSAADLLNHTPKWACDTAAYDEFREGETFFHRPSLTIQVYTGRDYYEVDLEQRQTSAELLDTILQIESKAWCTADTLKDFMKCLNQACASIFKNVPQAVFCPFGRDKSVCWRQAQQG